jgi:hypothetical protein
MTSVAIELKKDHIARFGSILERGHADVMIAGHEHLVWDENVALPGGGTIREVLVGCASGWYNFAPGKAARARANCQPLDTKKSLRCHMPNGGGEFLLAAGRKGRLIQHAKASFTLVTINGTQVTVTPMTLDASGRPIPFYLHGATPDLPPPIDEPEPELPEDEPATSPED